MPSFSMESFMAAQFAGQQLNTELANRKADTEMKQVQIQQIKQNQAAQQQQQQAQQSQQAQMAKLMSQFDTEQQAQQTETGAAPDGQKEAALTKESQMYRQIGKTFALSDPAKMESYMKMADSTDGRLQALQVANLKIGEKKTQDTAAYAGSVLDGTVTPQEAFKWVKDNVGLKDAMAMPTDPADYKNFWRQKQTQGLSAKDQVENRRKLEEDAQRAEDRKADRLLRDQTHRDAEADKAASRELLRSSIDSRKETAIDRKATAASATEFRQTEQLNKKAQVEAKPLLEDLHRLQDVKGLLKIDTAASDQQVQQALTSILGSFKGRATNKFYQDNKNFGSFAAHVEGFVSRGFQGRYKEKDRAMIMDMVTNLEKGTVEPALAKLEQQSKKHAEAYKLNPDQIEIQGDFNRDAKIPEYYEGQAFKNPKTGQTVIFKQGKWVYQ